MRPRAGLARDWEQKRPPGAERRGFPRRPEREGVPLHNARGPFIPAAQKAFALVPLRLCFRLSRYVCSTTGIQKKMPSVPESSSTLARVFGKPCLGS